VGAIVVARAYPFGTAMRLGSGYFPTVLGGILALFGVFLMARAADSPDRKYRATFGAAGSQAVDIRPFYRPKRSP